LCAGARPCVRVLPHACSCTRDRRLQDGGEVVWRAA
jgi:hypothetical protein